LLVYRVADSVSGGISVLFFLGLVHVHGPARVIFGILALNLQHKLVLKSESIRLAPLREQASFLDLLVCI
jgi:hypothetical protein